MSQGTTTLLERLLRHTEKTPTCWLWTGSKTADGYGRIRVDGRTLYVHRLMYETQKAPIPHRFQVDHLCKVRNCLNPQHLEAVTIRDNALRSSSFVAANAQKTHCVNAHELNEDNTYLRTDSKGRVARICRRCRRDWAARNPR